MSKSRIESWEGGSLRLVRRQQDGYSVVATLEEDYVPLGQGWAIPAASLSLPLDFTEDPELEGIVLDFEIRDGLLQCVGIRSEVGPGLKSTMLRKLGPRITDSTRAFFDERAIRLVELDDGT